MNVQRCLLWGVLWGMNLLAGLLLVPRALADDATTKPNIVVIFIDDLGYADIGPFGATKQKTPHLDRMAREGMKLTSFYAAPVCSVSRAQLLTGCYGARISVPGVFFPASSHGLHPDEWTVAERLKQQGYSTMCIGKWHLGDQPQFLPTKQGFDHYFGIPYSNDMQRVASATGERVVPLVRDEQVAELLTDEQQSRIVERYTDEALKFIDAHRQQPFFLYLPHSAVHTPIWPGAAFRGKSANGRFGDWVEEVDWSVGRVLDALRERQLDRKTLVIFTSDNGPWLIKGPDGGSALPLRGGKGSTWEGGVRVPTIAWWPGRVAAGSSCDAVAGTIDLLPTFVAIAGGKTPAEPVIDGRDISPLLVDGSTKSPRDVHYYFSGYELQAVRQGPWKLALVRQPESMGKDSQDDAAKNPRLYRLDEEIGERTNLAEKHPEIVAKLRGLAEKMAAEIGGAKPTSRRPPGVAENPVTLYPSEAPKPAAKATTKEASVKPADLSTLRVGDAVAGNVAPRVAAVPFEVSCTLATEQRSGIVLAHGGSTVGYAVHLRDGELIFTTNDQGQQHHVRSEFPTNGKPQRVVATLAKDGTLSLQVGDEKPVTSKSPGLLSRQPQEGFCVGHDDKAPLTEYASTTTLRGQVTEIKFRALVDR